MDSEIEGRFRGHIQALESFVHRGSASDNEAKAADYLVKELESLGLQPEQESFAGCGSLGIRLFVHMIPAVVGASLMWTLPLLTVLLTGASLVSLFLEGTTRTSLLSRLLLDSPSQNVVAKAASAEQPRMRIVVLGHYDTQRTGLIWRDVLAKRIGSKLHRLPGVMKSPFFVVVSSMILEVILGALALIGIAHTIITIIGVVVLVVLSVAMVLLIEWGVGEFVPGANDNATGTATVLALAEQWLKKPADDVEVIFLMTGCEESGLLGAAAWADTHREEIDSLPTRFLNIDGVGYGKPRFLSREHAISCMPVSYPEDIVKLCAEAADELELTDAGPKVLPVLTDGLALLARGIPGASIISFEDDGHLPNYHQMTDTSDHLDFDVAWQAAEFARAVFRRMIG